MTDPNQPEPFAPPYVLNQSSVTIENGEEVWPNSAPPPRPPRQRRWLAPVVIIGVVALVGGLVGVGAVELQAIGQRADAGSGSDYPPDPIITPIPAPSAPTPTAFSATCASGCLTVASSGKMIPDGSLQGSMPINRLSVSADFQHPTTATIEYFADIDIWQRQFPPYINCFFAVSRSPVSTTIDSPDRLSTDPVTFLGTSVDPTQGSAMTQTARFFTSPASAADYEQKLQAQISICHGNNPEIESAAGFDLPPGVSAVTFVDKEDRATTYVYDFQRANAVVRFRVVTSDNVDENAVRHFLGTWVTTNLAQLPVQ